MATQRIKWSVRNAYVGLIDIRKRRNRHGEFEEYAVFTVGAESDFDVKTLKKTKKLKKTITFMCFHQTIFTNLLEGNEYSFDGLVSFGYGNTFLCVEHAFDAIGIEVGKGHSLGEIDKPD